MAVNCTTLIRVAALGLLAAAAFAQPSPVVVLDIEIENAVRYFADTADPGKLALNPGITPANPTKAFTDTIFVGDIVAVNGKPAKGLWTSRQYVMNFSPNPAAGAAIADVTQGTVAECKYEILNGDGAFIGRLMDGGLAPHVVTGGTGAFLGVHGEQGSATARVVKAVRTASMSEDPANRRINGGGNVRILMRLVPAYRPTVLAVARAGDFSPVSANNPAKVDDTLSVFVTGLGPTTPAVTLGQPFPQSPLATVNAPVEVLVNGEAATVLFAGGFPGAVDGYQVNFRLPPGVKPGTATLQLTAAWTPAAEVKIVVR